MPARSVLLACCLLSASSAWAARNDSGQSRCYDGEDLVPCSRETTGDHAPFPRQDGRFGRDAQKLGFDLEPRDASGAPAKAGTPPACVLDRTTGLLWRAQPGKAAPWDGVPALVAQLNEAKACGRGDWRLPSRTELVSIVSYGQRAPAIETRAFPGMAPTPCWTADPALGAPRDRAWMVQLLDGASNPAPRATELQWLAVAGAPAAGGVRFEPLADGTVRDALTGLVWDRCTYGQSGGACEEGTPAKYAWGAALQVAVKVNRERYKGHEDWRVPSVKELESLVDVRRFGPAVDPAAFPRIQNTWYWSATPRAGNLDLEGTLSMWDVGLDDAHIGYGMENLSGCVILVRNADGYDALGGNAK